MPIIRVERSEGRLRFGEEDTPAPFGVIAEGVRPEIIVAVLPTRDVDVLAVGLVLAVDGREQRVQFRKHTSAQTTSKEQFWIAQFPKLRPGSEVAYEVVVLFSIGGDTEHISSTEGGRSRIKLSVSGEAPADAPPPSIAPPPQPVAAPPVMAPPMAVTTKSVTGKVVTDRGQPGSRIALRLTHRAFGGASELLGEGVTDEQGNYRIGYSLSGKANLALLAVDAAGNEVALNRTRRGVSDKETLNAVAPERLVEKRAGELERLMDALRPAIPAGATLGGALETDEHRDLTMLHKASQWDARLIALAALAEARSHETNLPAKALYALFRCGLPTHRDAISRLDLATFRAALSRARTERLIELENTELEEAAAAFVHFVKLDYRRIRGPHAVSSLGDLLDSSGLDEASREALLGVLTAKAHPPDTVEGNVELWDQIKNAGLSEGAVARLQQQGRLGLLTDNHGPLIVQLITENITTADELAATGHYEPALWQERLSRLTTEAFPTPALPPGETIESYANTLASRVRRAVPVQVVRQRIARGQLAAEGVDDACLRRLHRIAPNEAALSKLVSAGFRSALDVARKQVDAFANEVAGDLSTDEAAAIHGAATSVVGAALAELAAGPLPSRPSNHRSVLGPFAHLADLLRCVKNSPDHPRPLELLAARRPDLTTLAADESSTRPVHGIDLVNEILERDVAGPGADEDSPRRAYDALRRASFPRALPFDQITETLRGWLSRTPSKSHDSEPRASRPSLWQVRDAFSSSRDNGDLDESTASVFLELLGLSASEIELFTSRRSLVDEWYVQFGYDAEGPASSELTSRDNLVRRLQITVEDLAEISKAPFFVGIQPREWLVRVALFVRLREKLAMDTATLANTLAALYPRGAKIEDGLRTALVYLSHVVEIEALLDLPASDRPRIKALWSSKDRSAEARPWLAKTLGLSTVELDALVEALGYDPIRPLSDKPIQRLADDVPFASTLPFIRLVLQLREVGLPVDEAVRLNHYPFEEAARRLELTAAEVAHAAPGDGSATTLARLLQHLHLKRRLSATSGDMIGLFRSANITVGQDVGEHAARESIARAFSDALASLSRREAADIRRVVMHFDADWSINVSAGGRLAVEATKLREPQHIARILRAVDVAARLSVPVERILSGRSWLVREHDTASLESIRQALAKAHGAIVWRSVEQAVEEGQRGRRRDALVADTMRRRGFSSRRHLGEHFLIDPDTSADALTTRVDQAVVSMQRFLGRCILGLETLSPDAPSTLRRMIDASCHERVSSAEVWRAERARVLFPSVGSTAGDALKSPLFLDFERALESGNGSFADAEQSLVDYLRGLDDLARRDSHAGELTMDRWEGWAPPSHRPWVVVDRLPDLPIDRYFLTAAGAPAFEPNMEECTHPPRDSQDWVVDASALVDYGASAIGARGFAGRASSQRSAPEMASGTSGNRFVRSLVQRALADGASALFTVGESSVDFSDQRYALYYREVFFQAPYAAALRAIQEKRHVDAQRWLDALLGFWTGVSSSCERMLVLACADNLIAAGDHHAVVAADLVAICSSSGAWGRNEAEKRPNAESDSVLDRLVALEATTHRVPVSAALGEGQAGDVVREIVEDLLSTPAATLPLDARIVVRHAALEDSRPRSDLGS